MAKDTPFCVDFDDFCDVTVDALDVLRDLKVKHPKLLVTLFTIPKRTSAKTIALVGKLGDWVQLAPHGWRHSCAECLSWTADEAEEKIKLAAAQGISAPVFRAPQWLIDEETYTACRNLLYTVATHRTFRIPNMGTREYVYNEPTTNVRGVHGHVTDNSRITNNIHTMLDNGDFNFPATAAFVFPQDVACVF